MYSNRNNKQLIKGSVQLIERNKVRNEYMFNLIISVHGISQSLQNKFLDGLSKGNNLKAKTLRKRDKQIP